MIRCFQLNSHSAATVDSLVSQRRRPIISRMLIAVVAVSALLCNGVAQAASIGVNFNGGGPRTGAASLPADVAGHPRFAQVSWNNATGNVNTFGQALHDSNGNGTTAIATWTANSVDALPGTPTNANERLMDGYLNTSITSTTTVTVHDIPYRTYDVVVYFDGDNGSGSLAFREAIFDVNGTVKTGEDSEGRDFYNNGNTNGNSGGAGPGGFFQVPTPAGSANLPYSTVFNFEDTAGNNDEGNFFVFKDVNSPTMTLLASPGESGFTVPPSASVNAIQIIDTSVPEPASMLMVGLGGVLLLGRSRGRQGQRGANHARPNSRISTATSS